MGAGGWVAVGRLIIRREGLIALPMLEAFEDCRPECAGRGRRLGLAGRSFRGLRLRAAQSHAALGSTGSPFGRRRRCRQIIAGPEPRCSIVGRRFPAFSRRVVGQGQWARVAAGDSSVLPRTGLVAQPARAVIGLIGAIGWSKRVIGRRARSLIALGLFGRCRRPCRLGNGRVAHSANQWRGGADKALPDGGGQRPPVTPFIGVRSSLPTHTPTTRASLKPTNQASR